MYTQDGDLLQKHNVFYVPEDFRFQERRRWVLMDTLQCCVVEEDGTERRHPIFPCT